MAIKFSKKTFVYLEGAKENAFDKKWFEDNKNLYMDHVKEPFTFLVDAIDLELSDDFKDIPINSSSICRPLRPSNRALEKGFVKDFISIDIMQKKTSLFEWNPGIHINFSADKDENFLGGGLYMVSSRQIKRMRDAFYSEHKNVDKMLSNKSFVKSWTEIKGEQYKRFPKDYDINHASAKYIMYKQFYFSKEIKRSQIIKKDFIQKTVEDLRSGAELLNWIKDTVGVYKK